MPAPVRIGVIGVGRWGRVHIRTLLSLRERCTITHLCTGNPKNAGLVPHPVTVVAGWRELITSNCDAVIIASPPHTHAEIVEACVEAGKPCLVEKPLCLDVETAERLHARVSGGRVPVLVDHTYLFAPAYQALKRTVQERGEPVRAILSEGMAFGPFRPDTSVLWDWGPHDVSLCLDLLGASPEHVDALGGPGRAEDDPDMVSLRLEFPGSLVALIQLGRLATQKRRRFSVATETQLYLFDDRASDKLTATPLNFTRRDTDTASTVRLDTGPDQPSMVHVLSAFLDGLAGGDRSRFGMGLALDVTRVLAACDQALKTGRGHVAVNP